MSSRIDEQQARHVADLARLKLPDEALRRITRDLFAILDYVDQLDQVDVTGIEPTTHPLPLRNVLRDDRAKPSLSTDAALSNTPQQQGTFFRVPKVLARDND